MRSPLRTLAIAVPACLIAAALAAATPATAAAPLKVTNGNDAGAGSLRQALDTASTAGGGTIVISKGVQIALDAEVAYTGSGPLTLQGGGATVSAGGTGAFHLVRQPLAEGADHQGPYAHGCRWCGPGGRGASRGQRRPGHPASGGYRLSQWPQRHLRR